MDYKKITDSKILKRILYGLGIAVIALLIFQAGAVIGYRKADFYSRWGENYHRNFGGPPGGFVRGMGISPAALPNSHGTFGQVIKIEPSGFAVESSEGVEKTVIAKDDFLIRRFRDNIGLNDLKAGDFVVVIGDPNNQGQIEAKLIRVLPPPESFEENRFNNSQ